MKALVTGAAGFIGSSIVDELLTQGHVVVGIDSFTPYYSTKQKKTNLISALGNSNFTLHNLDLAVDDFAHVLDGVTDIFHQAGQPGVRSSWGPEFVEYVRWNIWSTQRLLELAKNLPGLRSFIAASSSSVYGSAERFPTSEQTSPQPISPYGVTKLASEHLCTLYGKQFKVPTVSLRYFTVYGPRQRPDMAISKIIDAGLRGDTFPLLGDGSQRRDFSFVSDVVRANLECSMAMHNQLMPGSIFNVGGGQPVSISEVLTIVEDELGKPIRTVSFPREVGDPIETGADLSLIENKVGWKHMTQIRDGLSKQIHWKKNNIE